MSIKGKKHCLDCGRKYLPEDLSKRGLCPICGKSRMLNAYNQITYQRGPIYNKYKAGMAAAFERRRKGK